LTKTFFCKPLASAFYHLLKPISTYALALHDVLRPWYVFYTHIKREEMPDDSGFIRIHHSWLINKAL